MPLEQIGSNLRLFGKSKVYNEGYEYQPSIDDNHDGIGSSSRHLHNEGDHDEWQGTHEFLNNDDESRPSHSNRYHQDEDMTLLKLGGVGGVQRSGSWAYGSRYSGRPSAFQNPLHDSPEDSDSTAAILENEGSTYSRKQQQQTSPRGIPWRSSSLHENDSHHVSQQRFNNPAPSTISRSSTSSSSTAAFSLRSLSNRNSTSSNGSSAGSSMRRLTSDEGHSNSTGSTIGAPTSTSVTSEDASLNSESTFGRSENPNRKSFSKHQSQIPEQDDGYSSSSQVVPRVQRIQSIGRGFDVRKVNREPKERASLDQDDFDEKGNSIQNTEEDNSPNDDTVVQEEEENHTENTIRDVQDHLAENVADQTAVIKDMDDTIKSTPHSPTPPTYMSDSMTLSPEPRSDSSFSGDRKSLFGSLTLTAAAQADRTTKGENDAFILPEPRRHTGSYALRSRSALSQTVGSPSMQFGNGQGRAAARKGLAMAAASAGGKMSADRLEPDQSSSTLNTPRANAVEVNAIRTTPADASHWQSKAFAISNLSQSGMSSSISPRTLPKDLTMSPTLNQTVATNQPTPLIDIGESRLSPIARASPDAVSLLQAISLDGINPSNSPNSPIMMEEERQRLVHGPMSASQASFDLTTSDTDFSSSSTGEGRETSQYARPSLARSSTSLAGMNVLRTPTTEEWSRFLIKQGLNPTAMATTSSSSGGGGVMGSVGTRANYKGSRSRTNTSRSAIAGGFSRSIATAANKRRISDREGGGWNRTNSLNSSTEALPSDVVSSIENVNNLTNMPNDLILAEIARQQQLRQRVSTGTADELRKVNENVNDEEEREEILGDGEEEMMERLSQADFDDEMGEIDSEEEELSDGLDEHMRALHEVISRPPSRRGTPAPSESGREKVSDSASDYGGKEASFDVASAVAATARRNVRWPTRDTAAALANYPLPPTGEQRSIHDFVIVDDIGRGAYGLVKKARVRDEKTGEPVGPEFAIKYIIKSRILADCWRRHKALGPIPVEIHVLDQLRRLAYAVPIDSPGWSAEKLFDCPALPPLGSTKVEMEGGSETVSVTVGHPSLCMMVDFFEDHEFYYMVMPRFGSGQDLFDYVESQPHGLTTKHVRCIFGQLADGLRFLHANNIVHRDVKDENVILDGNGHIQLIDFGSAAHIQSRRLFDTFSGTLDYAAAEILRGEKYGGKEQDVWALGVVGYVLLCGDCPFWNGEEAMEGLQMGTRAFNVLADRRREITKQEAMENFSQGDVSSVINEKDNFSGHLLTPSKDQAEQIVTRRKEDIEGQSDGGGRLDDATDLIMQCLNLEQSLRPTMEQICQHRFLIGQQGWIGRKGWENV